MRLGVTPLRTLRPFLLVALLVATACSDEQSASTTSDSTTSSSTSTTSSTTSTTSTSTSTTSTTVPAVEGLELSDEGLGDVLFGADAEGSVTFIAGILGAPTNDTGWLDPVAEGLACPGTTVRFVTWHDLVLFFTDDSPHSTGLRHFASYTYGPAMGERPDPFGLETAEGIGIGSTVQELRAAYPRVEVFPGDEIAAPSFFEGDTLAGFLTGAESADTITSFVGGYGCGE